MSAGCEPILQKEDSGGSLDLGSPEKRRAPADDNGGITYVCCACGHCFPAPRSRTCRPMRSSRSLTRTPISSKIRLVIGSDQFFDEHPQRINGVRKIIEALPSDLARLLAGENVKRIYRFPAPP